MFNNYSLYKIMDNEGFDFVPSEYSRFKFGDGKIAKKYGIELASGFIKSIFNDNYNGEQIVVISSPYSFIPTATFELKNYFVFELNHWLASHNFPVIQETKIQRTITYKDDYGELNAEERLQLIETDVFYVDSTFIKNKTLIFLDDIRITGSHEKMILKMMSDLKIENDFYLVYFAELVNHKIHPRIENLLNYSFVKSIFDLDNIINKKQFKINTRVVKFILISKIDSINIFLQNKEAEFIELLYNMAIGNNYHYIDEYKTAINFLRQTIYNKQFKKIEHGN